MDRIYHTSEKNELKLDIYNKDTNLIIYLDDETADITYDIKDSEVKIFYIILNDQFIDLKEEGHISGGHVTSCLFDLSKADVHIKSVIKVFDGAKLDMINKYLVTKDKDITIDCINMTKDTEVNIDNSAVILDDGHIELTCTGKIIKDAKRSISHQKSRSLVYGDPKHVDIRPILLIEESDVEASHALSSGTIDDDVLYYLNSRGIDKVDALRLLIDSYLKCDEELIKDLEEKDNILSILQRGLEENVG